MGASPSTLRDGVSLRLDHDTSIALVSPDRVDITSGAVYVDSGRPRLERGPTSGGHAERSDPARRHSSTKRAS